MYRELILKLSKDNELVKIQPPCPEKEIKRAENVVGYSFPRELTDFLREADGDRWLMMSAQEIIENIERNRKIYLPLFEEDYSKKEYIDKVDRFIFFASNGCGDYYCYRVDQSGIADESTIYIWEHEYLGEKCWKPVASHMAELITRYYNSEI